MSYECTGSYPYLAERNNRWSFALVTAPTVEPLSESELKLHGRITNNAEDALLTNYIAAARDFAEKKLSRQFITATWDLRIDFFPQQRFVEQAFDSWRYPSIEIHKCPVQSVTSVKYIDASGVEQTMSSSDYLVDIHDEPARITPAFGLVWPVARAQPAAVTVRFVAGYGDAPSAVPPNIRHWISLKAQSLYENREADTETKLSEFSFADSLLDNESWGSDP